MSVSRACCHAVRKPEIVIGGTLFFVIKTPDVDILSSEPPKPPILLPPGGGNPVLRAPAFGKLAHPDGVADPERLKLSALFGLHFGDVIRGYLFVLGGERWVQNCQ